jgi:hypothetical protein
MASIWAQADKGEYAVFKHTSVTATILVAISARIKEHKLE